MKNNIIEKIRQELEARKDRSAWGRGVNGYALEILDVIEERSNEEGHEPQTRAELENFALNGAQDYKHPNNLYNAWSVASWGGSYEIYNEDIAKRLCTPSELAKTRDGERRPNSREDWLDVQARALFQAFNRITRAYTHATAAKEG